MSDVVIPCGICNAPLIEARNVYESSHGAMVVMSVTDLENIAAAYSAHIVAKHTKGFRKHVYEAIPDDIHEDLKMPSRNSPGNTPSLTTTKTETPAEWLEARFVSHWERTGYVVPLLHWDNGIELVHWGCHPMSSESGGGLMFYVKCD